MPGTIVAGALGNCVHVAGVAGFLSIAEQLGYKTVFLGAAVPPERFMDAAKKHGADIVGVSYRLTPEVGRRLLEDLRLGFRTRGIKGVRFAFGGTPPMCEIAEKMGWFERCFSGVESPDEIYAYLRGDTVRSRPEHFGDTLLDRLEKKHPYPLLRHHFGLPSVTQTIEGVAEIAESGVLDVISTAPDQNAQESFFRREEMQPELAGAGGVPLRSEAELKAIYKASRTGNYPLLRIYSGTRDLLSWAEVAQRTIKNAWAAVPLCWYSVLDGRSDRMPEDAIRENQLCMRWHGLRGIPVEVNEPHHWGLRDSHGVTSVVTAYLAAYNAKRMGVSHYVAQYMFNTPPGISPEMDLAKVQAQIEMVESLHSTDFVSFRQVRAGLLHLSPQIDKAKGQLAASTMLALGVVPHIIHVVGYCEGDHAATSAEVIESCNIVHGVLQNCLGKVHPMMSSNAILERKRQLLAEAEVTLNAIRELGNGDEDPLSSASVIARAIAAGILDAPHLKGNAFAAGRLATRMVDGAVYAVDPKSGRVLTEAERIASLKSREGKWIAAPFATR